MTPAMRSNNHGRLKLGLAFTAGVLLFLALLPALAAIAWFGRVFLLALIPLTILMFIFSPRLRRWLEGDADVVVDGYRGIRLVSDALFHPLHSWARAVTRDRVTVGAADFVQRVLGPVDWVELPAAGERFREGQPLFQLRSGGRSVAVRAPFDGEVLEVNERLAEQPELVNSAPFDAGWAVRLRPDAPSEGLAGLRSGHQARGWFRAEVDRLLALLTPAPGAVPVMQDGGAVADELHRDIDDQTWDELRRRFFETE